MLSFPPFLSFETRAFWLLLRNLQCQTLISSSLMRKNEIALKHVSTRTDPVFGWPLRYGFADLPDLDADFSLTAFGMAGPGIWASCVLTSTSSLLGGFV